jgi:hypothetical protein
MLIGHVDAVSAERVGGWAFDGEFPDQRFEVSIFVDQQKSAEGWLDAFRLECWTGSDQNDVRHQIRTPLRYHDDYLTLPITMPRGGIVRQSTAVKSA